MNSKLYHLPFDKANDLNSSFAEQCRAPSVDTSPCFSPNLADLRFSFSEVTAEQVDRELSTVNILKAPGLDSINNCPLKLSRM